VLEKKLTMIKTQKEGDKGAEQGAGVAGRTDPLEVDGGSLLSGGARGTFPRRKKARTSLGKNGRLLQGERRNYQGILRSSMLSGKRQSAETEEASRDPEG